MKKDLRHIFDRASASELENLIDQNKAPEISSDTLDSIQSKVYAKTRISKVKSKKPLVFRWQSLAAAACLLIIVGTMLGLGVQPVYAAESESVNTLDIEKVKMIAWDTNIIDPATVEPFSHDIDLSKSYDEILIDLEGKDIVVQKDDVVIQGKELWDEFFAKTRDKQPAKIQIAYCSTDKDSPELFLSELSFDGWFYTRDTIQAFNPEYRDVRLFLFLQNFTGTYSDPEDETISYEYEHFFLATEPYVHPYTKDGSKLTTYWSMFSDSVFVCKFRKISEK